MSNLKDLNQFLIQRFSVNDPRFRYLESGALLPENWLLQTPNVWGMSKDAIPKGHSAKFAREFYNMMILAEESVLLSTLANDSSNNQGPDGDFLTAIRDAINYLGKTQKKVSVYVLIGSLYISPIKPALNSKLVLEDLTVDLKKIPGARVTVVVLVSGSQITWNHSKMLVIDNKSVLTGGHNLYGKMYLEQEPVFDLSMKLQGPIAVNARNYFINNWKLNSALPFKSEANYIPPSLKNNISSPAFAAGPPLPQKADATALSAAAIPSAVPVMSVGRYSSVFDDEPSDEAILYLIDHASESIKITQPTLASLFPNLWWTRLMSSLAKFIFYKNKHLYIVISSTNATHNYNCWGNFSDVYKQLLLEMKLIPGAPAENQLRNLLDNYLHVTHFAFSKDRAWSANSGMATHAKMILIDDEVFYIGSHNLYPATPTGLAEFGFIVQNKEAAKKLLDQYWNNLWEYSKSNVAVFTGKATYSPGETVDVYVKLNGETRNEAIRFLNEANQEEWWTWTGNIREGRITYNQYVVPAKYAKGQTIVIEYLTSGTDIKQLRARTSFKITTANPPATVELQTGKQEYVQNESIDVWVKVGGAIKDDSIRLIDESGREEWWTWTGNIREGKIINSYKVTDKYLQTGQKLRIDYLFDGNNTRVVRKSIFCQIKPMVVTIQTSKPVYKVNEPVFVFIKVYNAIPYRDSVTFHGPDGKEEGWMWTGNVVNAYIQQSWPAPARLKGKTVTIRYLYDGALKKWPIAQATFRIE